MILEDLKLSELRELHPDIKDTSKEGFIKKIHEKEGRQITLMEIIAEEEEEFVFPTDGVTLQEIAKAVEPEEETLAPEVKLDFSAIQTLVTAGLGGSDKFLIVTENSADKIKAHALLSAVVKDIADMNGDSIKTEDARHEIHYGGKTFIKCTCPNRYAIAIGNYKFNYILNTK